MSALAGVLWAVASVKPKQEIAPVVRLPGPPDAVLVQAAKNGEPWAKEALFRRYGRYVNGLAFRLLPSDAELDDLVQDSFVEALTSLDRLVDVNAFSSWLGSIVVRTAHKRIRRRRLMERLGLRRREEVDFDAFAQMTSSPESAVELRRVHTALDAMDAEERIALVLRRVEGMELSEVATQMGLSLATVKRRIASAETKLPAREMLERES